MKTLVGTEVCQISHIFCKDQLEIKGTKSERRETEIRMYSEVLVERIFKVLPLSGFPFS